MSGAILWRTEKDADFAQKYPKSEWYDKGMPYPDDVTMETFHLCVSNVKDKHLVLDGCTRSVGQVDTVVEYLRKEGYHISAFHLICPPEECKNRIARRVAYDLSRKRPVRADDIDPVAINNRFSRFFETIDDILDRFNHLDVPVHDIDTEMPIEVVQAEVLQLLGGRSTSTVPQ